MIDPAVFDVAQEIGQRAIEYAERLVGDPAVAATILEESAAAVSRALRMKQQSGGPRVRDLQAYLFRSFIRRVNKTRKRQIIIADSASAYLNGSSVQGNFEWKVLINEFLGRCDPITRDMFYRRIQGFSWKEIGTVYGISSHAAESRFGQALERVRRKLQLQK
jgi:DNA-directed RNA polymerase specialized sigma24 family protein